MNISNANIDDEDMADITDWTDVDSGTGVSSQVTFDGKSCMKLDSGGTAGSANYARRTQEIGTFGDRTVFSLNVYCDEIGVRAANNDFFYFRTWQTGNESISIKYFTDGLFIDYGGGVITEIATDLVVQDTWQEWTFDVDWVGKTFNVYLEGILVAEDIAICTNSALVNGTVMFQQIGAATINRLSYVDWFKAGDDFEHLLSPLPTFFRS